MRQTCDFKQSLVGPEFELGVSYSLPLEQVCSDWMFHATSLKVSGTEDHVILVAGKRFFKIQIALKVLSTDKSKRYRLRLVLLDKKSGKSKMNNGETMLMTEQMETGVEAGNVLELHQTTFEKYLSGGQTMLSATLMEIKTDGSKAVEEKKVSPPLH